tara:strand:+ start:12105 stop:14219 length:2115 start_codon:yes stop_codon:yes gene_type:complete
MASKRDVFAVLIASKSFWDYESKSYDSEKGFYNDVWLTNDKEKRPCMIYYQRGDTDETGFTPNSIQMNDANGVVLIMGKNKKGQQIRRAFKIGEPAPQYLTIKKSQNSRRPTTFIVTDIITDTIEGVPNIKKYLGIVDEQEEELSQDEDFFNMKGLDYEADDNVSRREWTFLWKPVWEGFGNSVYASSLEGAKEEVLRQYPQGSSLYQRADLSTLTDDPLVNKRRRRDWDLQWNAEGFEAERKYGDEEFGLINLDNDHYLRMDNRNQRTFLDFLRNLKREYGLNLGGFMFVDAIGNQYEIIDREYYAEEFGADESINPKDYIQVWILDEWGNSESPIYLNTYDLRFGEKGSTYFKALREVLDKGVKEGDYEGYKIRKTIPSPATHDWDDWLSYDSAYNDSYFYLIYIYGEKFLRGDAEFPFVENKYTIEEGDKSFKVVSERFEKPQRKTTEPMDGLGSLFGAESHTDRIARLRREMEQAQDELERIEYCNHQEWNSINGWVDENPFSLTIECPQCGSHGVAEWDEPTAISWDRTHLAEEFGAEVGGDCPSCSSCEHRWVVSDTYSDGDGVWVDVNCDRCDMKAGAWTYPFEIENMPTLRESRSVNNILECSRCRTGFVRNAETFAAEDDEKVERIMKLLRIVKRKATGSNARYAKTYADAAEIAYYDYGFKGLKTQVAYVLSNLSGWRGDEAREVKAELRRLVK